MGTLTDLPLFDVEPAANGVLRLWSHASFAGDGELIRLLAFPLQNGFWNITDDAGTVMHAEAYGVDMDGKRVGTLSKLLPRGISFAPSGELVLGPVKQDELLQQAMRLLTGVLVVSYAAMNGVRQARVPFETKVDHLLAAEFGEKRVVRRRRYAGGSGHLIEVPLVLDAETPTPKLVTTIGTTTAGTFDWGQVYGVAGKLADLKLAGFRDGQRFVVIDDEVKASRDIGQAETILAEQANVVPFSRASAMRVLLEQRLN